MRSYETARTLFGFLEFVAWAIVVLGVVAGIMIAEGISRYASGGELLIAALPGVAISLFGLIFVAIVQTARATVDSAEYAQQMLKIARDQLEVSQQALRGSGHHVPGFEKIATDAEKQSGFVASDFEKEVQETAMSEPKVSIVEQANPEHTMLEGETTHHMGQVITFQNGQYLVDGSAYQFLDFAINHVNKSGVQYEYVGHKIKATSGRYQCNGYLFDSVGEAEQYVDELDL